MAGASLPTLEQRLAVRERPVGRVMMEHTWERLLFLHWRFPAAELQTRLPPGLHIDTFDGDAWLGIVPFFMRNIRIRGLPRIPGATNFLEINLRTYVFDDHGTPGVWFFSLDADSWLTVLGARASFGLPYRYARMSAASDVSTGRVDYQWLRRGEQQAGGSRFEYRPQGESRPAEPGSLEFFLVERYVLFSEVAPGRVVPGAVHHPPYPVTSAELVKWDDRLIALNGFSPPCRPPEHALYSSGVTVDVYPLRRRPIATANGRK